MKNLSQNVSIEMCDREISQKYQIIHGCSMCEKHLTKILFTTKNFYVALDISPIVEGHLMIISNNHIGCAAEIDEDWKNEFFQLKEFVGNLVEEVYGNKQYYEHGRAGHCLKMSDSGIMCNHFHLHCLPTDVNIHNELKKNYLHVSLKNEADIFSAYERYGSYLYFEGDKYNCGFYPASDENVQAHLLRTLICNATLQPEKNDWEKVQDEASAIAAFQKYNIVLKRSLHEH